MKDERFFKKDFLKNKLTKCKIGLLLKMKTILSMKNND